MNFTVQGDDTDLFRVVSISGGIFANASSVQFPVWSDTAGQDDLVWYAAHQNNAGVWEAYIPLSNHRTPGRYTVHCYAIINGVSIQALSDGMFDVDPSIITKLGYGIIGNTQTTVSQMVARYNAALRGTNHTYPSDVYASKGAPTIEAFCQILLEECNAEGIRAEVIFCQSMKETGWLQFGGAVQNWQCNFAGIGAIDSAPTQAATFPDVRTGLRAQVQHMKAYSDPRASIQGLAYPCVDPRFDLVTPKGKAPNVENLGNGNWATATDYGSSLLKMIEELTRY